jgi:ketosteroid isomerase-like protein
MPKRVSVLTAAIAGALLACESPTAASPAAAAPACPTSGPESPGELHRQWILEGWEYRPGDPQFSFRNKLGRFYDWDAKDAVLFDDFDPERRAVRSVADYQAIWEPIFRGNRSARHAVSDAPVTMFGSDLAASSLEFTARIETLAGRVTGIRTRSDLVWRCRPGGWKIAREHNSSRIIPTTEAERVIAATPDIRRNNGGR